MSRCRRSGPPSASPRSSTPRPRSSAGPGSPGPRWQTSPSVAGVSVGTLYNYVEGKEALLLLCAEHPFGAVAEPRPLPVPVLDRGALIHAVEATLAAEVRVPALEAALAARERPGRAERAELAAIVGELFDLFASTRRAADAMERCAREAPDLAEVFYRGVRGRLLAQLAAYCERLDDLALAPDVAGALRRRDDDLVGAPPPPRPRAARAR